MTYTDVTETAKSVRKELKASFPGVKFSVRSSRFSGGSSVSVRWTDGPAPHKVREITDGHAEIHRCEYTGEILAGSNRYVHADRDYSQEAEAWGRAERNRQFGMNPTPEEERHSYEPSHRLGRVLQRTTFSTDPTQPPVYEPESWEVVHVVEEAQPDPKPEPVAAGYLWFDPTTGNEVE